MTYQNPTPPKPDVNSYQLLIDGKFTDGSDGGLIERASPAHGDVVNRYAKASASDTERAILSACKAFDFGPWPRMTGAERSRILFRPRNAIAYWLGNHGRTA